MFSRQSARFTGLASLVVGAAAVPALAQSAVSRWVFGTGGDRTASASLTITCTLGQPVIGPATGPTHTIVSGFWNTGGGPAPCYANCDQSTTPPVLNVNDFVCFQTRFAAADPAANCDASTTTPVLNVLDFVCFQSRFAAGCP